MAGPWIQTFFYHLFPPGPGCWAKAVTQQIMISSPNNPRHCACLNHPQPIIPGVPVITSSSIIFHHLPSSSIIFHHLPSQALWIPRRTYGLSTSPGCERICTCRCASLPWAMDSGAAHDAFRRWWTVPPSIGSSAMPWAAPNCWVGCFGKVSCW